MVRYVGEQIFEQANANYNKQIFGSILYNVKAYGAKGNGIADDTAAINKTIAYAGKTGGIVFFPDGEYLCREIQLPSNVAAEGAENSLLTYNGIGGSTSFLLGNENQQRPSGNPDVNIRVSNLMLDGTGTQYTVLFVGVHDTLFDNVRVIGGGIGLHLAASRYVKYVNCLVRDVPNDGFSLTDQNYLSPTGTRNYSQYITYENCIAERCGDLNLASSNNIFRGFEVDDGPSNIKYSNCTAIDCPLGGFDMHIHKVAINDTIVMENISYENCSAINCCPDHDVDLTELNIVIGGFTTGSINPLSILQNITYTNCTSVGNRYNAYGSFGTDADNVKRNVQIIGGTWQLSPTSVPVSVRGTQDNTVINAYDVIHNITIKGAMIDGSGRTDCFGYYSINFTGGIAKNAIVEGCTFTGCAGQILMNQDVEYSSIINNTFISNAPLTAGGNMIALVGTAGVISNNIIEIDAQWMTATNAVIRDGKPTRLTVSANVIINKNATKNAYGIQLVDFVYASVSGNVIDGFSQGVRCQQAASSGKGVFIGNSWANNTTPYAIVAGHVVANNDTTTLYGTATLDPVSLADGAGVTLTITVTGAALGDFAEFAAPYSLQGITTTAFVSAADTVSIRLQNETTSTIDLASGTWKARVTKT